MWFLAFGFVIPAAIIILTNPGACDHGSLVFYFLTPLPAPLSTVLVICYATELCAEVMGDCRCHVTLLSECRCQLGQPNSSLVDDTDLNRCLPLGYVCGDMIFLCQSRVALRDLQHI